MWVIVLNRTGLSLVISIPNSSFTSSLIPSKLDSPALGCPPVSAQAPPFFSTLFSAEDSFQVLGTKLEVRDGKLTGRFLTPNCYGQEKVNRLKQVLNEPRQAYSIKAFGDSRGDKELLEYADQGHYKPFR